MGIMTIRRLGVVFSGVVLAVAFVAVAGAPAGAASGGGECQLAGTANFAAPGLGSSSANFSYHFSGSLSGCNSNVNAPTSGSEEAGLTRTYSVTLTNTSTGVPATFSLLYQEPIPSGTGSCGSSTTAGEA